MKRRNLPAEDEKAGHATLDGPVSGQMRGLHNDELHQLADAILLIGKMFHTVMTRPAEREELTLRQIEVIEIVDQHPEINVSELAERLRLANSTVSELVQRLVESAHLRRSQNPENRREVRISLTGKGGRFLEDRRENVLRSLEKMLGQLSHENSRKFADALTAMAELANEAISEVHDVR